MGKQHCFHFVCKSLFCFSMQDSCTDWVLFKELYYWGQDLFSLFSQLDSLSATMGQDKCEQFCTQMNPDSSATLFKFTPLSSRKEKNLGQLSKPEMEFLP